MKVTFTSHAQYRLMERKISLANVRDTILNSNIYLAAGGLLRARKEFSGKTLEVVYKKSKNDIVVVTAYYL